jgi:hypothetical protein
MPVRSLSKPWDGTVPLARSSSSATNMVGTPYSAVARSSCTARSEASGLKASLGNRIAEPCVAVAMYPRTSPKQWNKGGGQQTTSSAVSRIRSPMKYPLFKIDSCVRHAAFGRPVVPDVNWMLIVSCLSRGSSGTRVLPFSLTDPFTRSVNGVVAFKRDGSILPSELSTTMTLRSEGTDSDRNLDDDRSPAISFRSVIFSRGGLYGRFVSVPIMRWAAERWASAAIIW